MGPIFPRCNLSPCKPCLSPAGWGRGQRGSSRPSVICNPTWGSRALLRSGPGVSRAKACAFLPRSAKGASHGPLALGINRKQT